MCIPPNFEVHMPNENIQEENLACTCDDKFVTEPCPVHYKNVDTYNGPSIITDELMVKEAPIRQLTGHMFICPQCNEEAILHFFRFCPHCGIEVLVQSTVVTDFIRQQKEA